MAPGGRPPAGVGEHDDAKRNHRHPDELDDQDVHGNFPKIEPLDLGRSD
jgi:hypothetical protein